MPGFVRTILIGLDAVIFTILEQIFMLIRNLASFELFSPGVLDEFTKRVYLILGLVMVFKLMLSFIQMLIDPDKMEDKENGVVNILKRVVISMILIVLVPGIFSFAKKLQLELINIIPKVVVGTDINVNNVDTDATTSTPFTYNENEEGNVEVDTGKLMAYYSFLPFFYYNEGCEGLGTLNGTTSEKNQANVKIYSVVDAVGHVNDKSGCSATDDGYDYNYRYLISTAVGIFLGYVLVTVALKIAIRTIKFGLCELIAPIPIASYIDPKSSKKAFDNWVSTSIKVYLDLFTRLIVVYFIIYIFKVLFDNEKFLETLGKYGPFQGLLVGLFIITGLLYFAKEMPKFISNMLGVPDGFSDIGDMFKGQGWKALGTTIGGAAGLAAQPLSSAITNYKTARKMGEGKGTALRRAFNSGVGGVFRSGRAFVNNEGFAGTYTKAHTTSLNNALRRINIANDKRREKSEKKDKKYAENMLEARYSSMYGRDFSTDVKQYNANSKEIAKLSTEITHYNEQIEQLREQARLAAAQGDVATVSKLRNRVTQLRNQKNAAETRKTTLTTRNDSFMSNAENAGGTQFQQLWDNYTKDIQHAPGTISGTLSNAWNTFTGTPMASSSSYSKAATLMANADALLKDWCVLVDKEADQVDVAIARYAAQGITKEVASKLNRDTTLEKSLRTSPTGPAITKVTVDHYSDLLAAYKEAQATGSATLDLNVTDESGATRVVRGFSLDASELEMLHKRMQKSAGMIVGGAIDKELIKDQKRKDAIEDVKTHMDREMIVSNNDTKEVADLRAKGIEELAGKGDDLNKRFIRESTEMAGREQLQQESKKSGS